MNQNATSESESLTPKQQKALGALLKEPTLDVAAIKHWRLLCDVVALATG